MTPLKFLVDRCTGTRLSQALRADGHDVVHAAELGADPGDQALLAIALQQSRVLVTIDQDFGNLVFVGGLQHAGLVRLPDVPPEQRIALMRDVIARHADDLRARAMITVQRDKIRIRRPG